MNFESKNIEYKRLLNDKFEKSVIGFLNSKDGGTLYIGIDDDKSVFGVENPDLVQRQIADRIKNNIRGECLGLYDISLEEIDGKNVVKISISSGTEKPYYLKEKGMTSEGCFIRNGSRVENMTDSMIERAFARRTRNTLSAIVSPRQDLTFEQLKIFYEEHGKKLNEHFASSLDLLTADGTYNLNAFLFADQNTITIKVAKFATDDKTQLIENEEYGFCSIIKSCKRVLEKLEIENKTFAKIEFPFRKEQKMIDEDSLREAVINAFVHNDYSDLMSPAFYIFKNHLEIVSYGGLVDGMSKEELVEGFSRPRNREVMRIFRDVDLVEQLGTGMNKMMSAYSPDIFRVSPNFLKVDFTFASKLADDGGINGGINGGIKLSEAELLVLNEIRNNPHVTNSELVQLTAVASRTVDRCIKSLREKNIIVRKGAKKNGHWELVGAN